MEGSFEDSCKKQPSLDIKGINTSTQNRVNERLIID